MEKLTDDLLSNIFIRVLAKQLAQMRCVCKSWNALLSEPFFVKSHLHHSIHNNKDEILLFFDWEFSFDRTRITARSSRSPNLELTNFIKIPVHPLCRNGSGSVIGSVNGLICFSYGLYSSGNCVVGIWNPSLSAVSPLPPCSLSSYEVHFGFGFNPQTDDYKVVKLPSLIGTRDMAPKGEVYSMRKGSWGSISLNFPSHITMLRDRNAVCLDGHLHWVCKTVLEWSPDTILAFYLSAETFHEILLPDYIIDYHGYRFNALGVLSGKLSVMSCVGSGEYEVWVMDEYGVSESWVKHCVFPHFDGVPYGVTSQNQFLLRRAGHDRYDLYDPITTNTKTFEFRLGPQFVSKITEYVDSLVWIPPPAN